MAYHGFVLKLQEVIRMENINQATQPTQSIVSLLFLSPTINAAIS